MQNVVKVTFKVDYEDIALITACFPEILVQVNRTAIYSERDTFSFQAPGFYKNHGYGEVFTLEAYPYTGKRHYYTKEIL